jgi:hypothetical protein
VIIEQGKEKERKEEGRKVAKKGEKKLEWPIVVF